jgi:hypothetical protein
MSKIYGIVGWGKQSENNWFVTSKKTYVYVLDSDFNIVIDDNNLEKNNSIQKTFKTNLEKYDYKQIDNYFCKIPKTISIYYQDTEKSTYHHSYFLLQNLHDTRTIIFKFLLELKRVDYDGYKKIDI